MRKLTLYVLWFMAVFWITGCVVTVNNNWGSNIQTKRQIDDQMIGQEYDAQIEPKGK